RLGHFGLFLIHVFLHRRGGRRTRTRQLLVWFLPGWLLTLRSSAGFAARLPDATCLTDVKFSGNAGATAILRLEARRDAHPVSFAEVVGLDRAGLELFDRLLVRVRTSRLGTCAPQP